MTAADCARIAVVTPDPVISTDRNPAPALLIGDFVLLTVLLLMLASATSGWFSADEVVLRQQSALLSDFDRWTLPPDALADRIDPGREMALLARTDRLNGEVLPYARHPLTPAVFSLAHQLPGQWTLLLPNAVAALAASMILSYCFGWSRIALWAPTLATPLLFHTSVVWAHALAFVFAMLACAALWIDRRSALIIAGAAVFVGSLFRTEMILLGAALSAALLIVPTSNNPRGVRSLLPMLAGALAHTSELWFRGWLFEEASAVDVSSVVAPAPSATVSLASRLEVAELLLFTPSIAGDGSLRLVGLILLLVAAFGRGSGWMDRRSTTVILIGAVLTYGLELFASATPSLFVAMPLIAVAVTLASPRDPAIRWAIVAFSCFVGAVVLTSYDNGGGGDWGARYLFVGVPLLLLVAGTTVARSWGGPETRSLLLAGAVATACIQVGILHDLLDRSETVETVDAVVETARRQLDDDPRAAVAVSDERLSRFLYDQGLRGAAFHVPPDLELRFDDLLEDAGVEYVTWIDLPDRAIDRPGELIETHGSVSIRTEVRR